jgi:hypothetical protein
MEGYLLKGIRFGQGSLRSPGSIRGIVIPPACVKKGGFIPKLLFSEDISLGTFCMNVPLSTFPNGKIRIKG